MGEHTPGRRAAKHVLDALGYTDNDRKLGIPPVSLLDTVTKIIDRHTAAPALLEACKELIEEAREDNQNPSLMDAFSHGRAAIADATKGGDNVDR